LKNNCGIADHDEYCLCDVIAPHDDISCKQWIDPIREGFYGKEIAEYLAIASPYSPEELFQFFEMQVELYDQLSSLSRITLPPAREAPHDDDPSVSKIPREVLTQIAVKVLANVPSPTIRQWAVDTHGVTISPSHMSHLRKRLVKENS
jgi:hypothetical protein